MVRLATKNTIAKLLQADIRSSLIKQLVPVATFIAGGKELSLYDVEQIKPSKKNP